MLALTARFRAAARQAGLPLADSATPIQPIPLGSTQAALAAQQALREAGFWVVAIRSPTVPAGAERLRVTLTASHRGESGRLPGSVSGPHLRARPIP